MQLYSSNKWWVATVFSQIKPFMNTKIVCTVINLFATNIYSFWLFTFLRFMRLNSGIFRDNRRETNILWMLCNFYHWINKYLKPTNSFLNAILMYEVLFLSFWCPCPPSVSRPTEGSDLKNWSCVYHSGFRKWNKILSNHSGHWLFSWKFFSPIL